jgi:hypothetical protein
MKSNEENRTYHGCQSEKEEGDSEEERRERKGESKAEGQEFFKAIHEEFQAKSRWCEKGRQGEASDQEEGCKANSAK